MKRIHRDGGILRVFAAAEADSSISIMSES